MPNQPPKPSKAFAGELQPGTYYWCTCGRSREQPFCDGSHVGTSCNPVKFHISRPKHVSLCGCKQTRTMPYCDQSCTRLPDPKA